MFAFQLSRGLKNKKVRLKFKEDIEPQEIFLDSLAQKKEEEFGISEKKFEVPLLKKILQGLLIFALALILALFAKTFQLQVIENKNFIALAEENKFIIHRIQAERGVIYDQNLNQLVFNQPSFDLICKKAELPQDEDEREKIFEEVDMYLKEADAILNLPDDKSERLKTLLFGIDGKLKRHVNLLSHWSFDFYRPGLSEKEKEIMEEDSEKFNIIQQKREELLEKFKKNE